MNEKICWVCFKGTRLSVLKGWFDSLERARNYFLAQSKDRRKQMVILNFDRTKILFPKE